MQGFSQELLILGVTKIHNVRPKTAKFYRLKTMKICLEVWWDCYMNHFMPLVVAIATVLNKKVDIYGTKKPLATYFCNL